jgi:hypothetical protein
MASLVLSVLALLACLAGAVGVWVVKGRADRVVTAVFTAADDAFEFMDSRLALVRERVDSSREQVDGLAARAQRLQAMDAEPEARAEGESLRFALDTLVGELHAAEGWLDSIEAIARGVHSAASSLAQSQAQSQNASAGVRAERVAHLASDLAVAINRLDVLRAELLEMRENRLLAREFAAMMIAAAADLDTRFANLARHIDEFAMRVSEVRADSIEADKRVHRWITFTAIALTVALLWFAASQACMLTRAWRLVQADRGPAIEPAK